MIDRVPNVYVKLNPRVFSQLFGTKAVLSGLGFLAFYYLLLGG